ncbi:Piwi domain-containing protein [Jiulongibacter sediminis]|uniref:Protein argonaute n=1 Tax=Jiulongibacter sediminis TaxID=1605367 RepID=A0A0P7B8G8_9BACT|nr:Piwi domain-containing protein [Jiulongibacter sediminis]KPM46583.1 hypothetical protein AFM12_19190 [Jiulongibacter sediminis]MCR9065189.1 Piwi domain-containing protein [Cytophagales bacterium]TBX21156.1 hypothetical protein TK44_19195 [Jiulongibacter sediminis]
MNQQLQINIIPLNPKEEELTFHFLTHKPDHETYSPIHKNDIGDQLFEVVNESDLEHGNWLYTNFGEPQEGSIALKLNLKEHPYFALHYFRHVLREHFRNGAAIMHRNFTKDIELWYEAKEQNNQKYTLYYKFTLKVQHAYITEGPELVFSFDGTSKVLKKSLAEIKNFNTRLYHWIAYKSRLYEYNYMPEEIKNDLQNAYPVLSNTLKPFFEIAFDSPDLRNRYPKYKRNLDGFAVKYLSHPHLKEVLGIIPKMTSIEEEGQIDKISDLSYDLEYGKDRFGNRYTGRDPKKDFKKYKAYRPVPPPNTVKFFFIYQKNQKNTAVKTLYNFLKDGYKHDRWPFPPMEEYISQPFQLDLDANIEFENIDTAFETIRKAVRTLNKEPETRYMALFVNPVLKLSQNTDHVNIYYRIKEVLLREEIASQVIKAEHLWQNGKPNDFFNAFLPHIEVAMLAKLGGIPWRLKRPSTNELIVGVGAFYNIDRKTRFVGSAFCFNNEGIFKGFECFKSTDEIALAGSIREAVGKFIAANYQADRLIIHFYKAISKNELRPIMATLKALGLPIPVIIITINKTESADVIGFDTLSPNLMPQCGTYIKVGRNQYLLYCNTRYGANSNPSAKEYHFPIKLSISCTTEDYFKDPEVIKTLIDQVYQFSRMYWKSTDQQSLPVTIKYPAMVAKIYPYFKDPKLPEFGKETLWFL